MGTVQHPRDSAEFKKLFDATSSSGQLMVVQFSMEGCHWCVKIAPAVAKLAAEYPRAVFAKVMAETCREVVAQYEVRGFPHFKLFVGGELKHSVNGANEADLSAAVKRYYNPLAGLKSVGWGSVAAGAARPMAPSLKRAERKLLAQFLTVFDTSSVNQAYHFLKLTSWNLEHAAARYMENPSRTVPDYFGPLADSYLPRARKAKLRAERKEAAAKAAAAPAPAPAPAASAPPPAPAPAPAPAAATAAPAALGAPRFIMPGVDLSGGGACEGGMCAPDGGVIPMGIPLPPDLTRQSSAERAAATGNLWGGAAGSAASPAPAPAPTPTERVCPACTFINAGTSTSCEICSSKLA